jgi:hypothetical protein
MKLIPEEDGFSALAGSVGSIGGLILAIVVRRGK